MACEDSRLHLEVRPHHEQRRICASRAKYREGRRLRAVRVFTINLESRYLLVQGVPAIGVMQELVAQFALFGAIEEYNVLDEYPAEEFTEVYLLKFQRLQSARVAKRKLDERSFFGGILHICYAPEFEGVQETREKLQDRRRYVARATSDKDDQFSNKRQKAPESSTLIPVHSAVNCAHTSSYQTPGQSDDCPAPFYAPPPSVTQDYRHEFYPPPSINQDYRHAYNPPPSVSQDYRPEYNPPPSMSQDYRHEYYPPPSATQDNRHAYNPPPSVTPDYRHEYYPPPSINQDYRHAYNRPPSVSQDYRPEYNPPPSATQDYRHAYNPPPSMSQDYRHENNPPPSVSQDYKQEYNPPSHSLSWDSRNKPNESAPHTERPIGLAQGQPNIVSSTRFMPRTTQLQERQRRREESTRLAVLPPESQEIVVGPKLPEIPKLDMTDNSLNISAGLIRSKLQEVSASCTLTRTDPPAAPPIKQRRRI
ncbi:RNA-binding protein 48 isoform X1 [Rana temporaria]|uniref:RNA-binding protein 48 isoform X1 n=1 Tax=Rana temporaria TaxID=8407 RepID=UPI001AACAF08|nr:RNA-binding protein 48 isoform X1 [Rana temporaria]